MSLFGKISRNLNILLKKSFFYIERDEEKRKAYFEELRSLDPNNIIYIDETGIEHTLVKGKGWCERGKKLIGERIGKRVSRTNVIAALHIDKIIAPACVDTSIKTDIFLLWFEKFLIPLLIPGQIIILDNAAFHSKAKITELLEKVGCRAIFLPPYSPDLNKIENYWAVLKEYIRKTAKSFSNFSDAIDAALQNEKRYFLS
jgi:transposase